MSGFYCGTGCELITPDENLLKNLYALMKGHFGGIIDDLHVRVILIGNETDKMMFIGWELDKAPNPAEWMKEISEYAGIPEDNILYFGTHTHTAPMHSARPGDGPNAKAMQKPEVLAATNAYEDFIKAQLFKAIDAAVSGTKPVKLGFGYGESFIGENRVQEYLEEDPENPGQTKSVFSIGSNPEGIADPSLFVLEADDLEGKPVAFFINHAVHNCIMINNNYDGKGGVGISADLAGQISSLLEERYPGAAVIWSSGAAGDINPVMMNQFNAPDPVTGLPAERKDFSSSEPAELMLYMMSRRQYADVLKAIRTITCDISDGEIKGASAVASAPFEDGREKRVKLKGVRIGNVAFCGASGELFGSLGRKIQGASEFDAAVVINHECSLDVEAGYVFDDETIEKLNSCEPGKGGLPGSRGGMWKTGYMPESIRNTAKDIFERIS